MKIKKIGKLCKTAGMIRKSVDKGVCWIGTTAAIFNADELASFDRDQLLTLFEIDAEDREEFDFGLIPDSIIPRPEDVKNDAFETEKVRFIWKGVEFVPIHGYGKTVFVAAELLSPLDGMCGLNYKIDEVTDAVSVWQGMFPVAQVSGYTITDKLFSDGISIIADEARRTRKDY